MRLKFLITAFALGTGTAQAQIDTAFWFAAPDISSQDFLNNSNAYAVPPISSFNIVASEDNTPVTVTSSKNIVRHTANSNFSIILNKKQTYAAIATSQSAAQHLGAPKLSAQNH